MLEVYVLRCKLSGDAHYCFDLLLYVLDTLMFEWWLVYKIVSVCNLNFLSYHLSRAFHFKAAFFCSAKLSRKSVFNFQIISLCNRTLHFKSVCKLGIETIILFLTYSFTRSFITIKYLVVSHVCCT